MVQTLPRPLTALAAGSYPFLVRNSVLAELLRALVQPTHSHAVTYVQGTVCFSAGLHAWAFSIPQFAQTYAAKTSTPKDKWVQRLWGENFLDGKTGKWQKQKSNDNVRGFVKFIYEPIFNVIQAAMNDQKDKLWGSEGSPGMLSKLGIESKLSAQERELVGKPLMKRIMQARVCILLLHRAYTWSHRARNKLLSCGPGCLTAPLRRCAVQTVMHVLLNRHSAAASAAAQRALLAAHLQPCRRGCPRTRRCSR